jgi:quercetin dioxygenase-like cupin family protein
MHKKLHHSIVYSLDKLIEYQDDSIVSKTLINSENGTITLFAFDQNQALSPHTAPFNAMVKIVDGVAKITISEKEFYVNQGEIIIMPANIPHAVKAVKKMKMLLTMIHS